MTYRVGAVEMASAISGDNRNPESKGNDDYGTGDEGLDSLMSLEPSTG